MLQFTLGNTNNIIAIEMLTKEECLGFTDDEFPTLTDATLIDAQRYHKKNRDLALLRNSFILYFKYRRSKRICAFSTV